MDLGEVMFWKAIVLAIGVLIAERWYAFKKKRNDYGIPLKQDAKTGTYKPDDWPERLERGLIKGYWRGLGAFYLLSFAVVALAHSYC